MTSSDNSYTPLVVVPAALAVAVAMLAGVVWLGGERQAREEAARQSELKRFHAELLSRIESLAERSGTLTSADLCPVRFRLRTPNGLNTPVYVVNAAVSGREPGGSANRQTARNGTVDFGLMPPGHYQLKLSIGNSYSLAAEESYSLEHDFDVLPGVPIDRVVLCPLLTPPELSVTIETVWPETVTAEDVIVVFDVEQDAVALGEWNWQSDSRLSVRVPATNDGHTISEDQLACIAAESEDLEVLRSVPFRYSRVRAIHLYRRESAAQAPLTSIARYVFEQGDNRTVGQGQTSGSTWQTVVCQGEGPQYSWDGQDSDSTWRIMAPDELVIALQMLGDISDVSKSLEYPFEFAVVR